MSEKNKGREKSKKTKRKKKKKDKKTENKKRKRMKKKKKDKKTENKKRKNNIENKIPQEKKKKLDKIRGIFNQEGIEFNEENKFEYLSSSRVIVKVDVDKLDAISIKRNINSNKELENVMSKFDFEDDMFKFSIFL